MKLTNRDGFTRVDNYFFDRVMPKVSGAEWKIVSTVLRATSGCFQEDAEISIAEFMVMAKLQRQAVIKALEDIRLRGAVERRAQHKGRQHTFRFRAVRRANLKEIPEPTTRRKQTALPFDVLQITEFENQTQTTPSDTVEIAGQMETEFENQTLTQCENQTSIGPVLIVDLDLKKERSKIKNAVDKTDREPQAVEKSETPDPNPVTQLCRFCSAQHDDPVTSPAVTLYYDRFRLMPNEGFRHDIWLTVQNLLLWAEILDGWWYPNARGKRIDKNPLGIKQLLSVYDEAVRNRKEARA